ncbi:MAG: acetate--CoA ligase [Promethearchaeota archaeon]
MTDKGHFESLFNPKSIAVIGASDDPLKFGNWVTMTVVNSGFRGPAYLVNPRAKKIEGRQVWPSVLDVPGDVELAGIIVSSQLVPEVMEQCVEKGVRAAIVFSSGFGEVGEEGERLQGEVLRVAKRGGIRLVGPNCMGIYSSSSKMNMTILSVKGEHERGEVAFITQSGGYGMEIFGTMMGKGVHFSKFISTGDKADLKDWEFLEYLRDDPDTRAILLYLEGIQEGRKFFEVARQTTPDKPIFAIKVGRTEVGGRAAASHTGALAGEDRVYDAAFKQAGVIRAYDVEELFDYVKAYTTQKVPKGKRVGMLVGSGGLGCAAVDKCVELGLEVPQLDGKNQEAMREILPGFASVANPVDFTGSGAMHMFMNVDVLERMFRTAGMDAWFFGFTGTGISGLDDIIHSFQPLIDSMDADEVVGGLDVSLVGCIGEGDRFIRPLLEKMFGATFFPTPERAIRALHALYRYGRVRESGAAVEVPPEFDDVDLGAFEALLAVARSEGRDVLTEVESKRLVAAFGIPVVETKLAASADGAVGAASQIGYPVALKVSSPDVAHKSDVGGVALGLKTPEEVREAFDQVVGSVDSRVPGARIEGVAVQAMAGPGVEVIVGTKVDPQFGPTVLFGVGGVLVEVLGDVALRLAPISRRDAREMVDEIKGAKLLDGFRGVEPVDKGAVLDVLLRASSLAVRLPQVKEVDLNPVVVMGHGALVVDARVVLQ